MDRPDRSLSSIRAAVLKARGLDLSYYKENFIRRRLAIRQRAVGLPRLARYAAHLESDAAEMEHLLNALTVNVSEFFRNPGVFRILDSEVIPGLLEDCRRDGRPLGFWSAGCATGEEAYSVAILLHRAGLRNEKTRLVGTDIDRNAVARARAGVFDASHMGEVDETTLADYFEPEAAGRGLRVRKERLPRIQFQVRDAMSESFRRNLDLVFCRNLLIYVEPRLQENLLASLALALRPGGVLVLGRVERLLGDVRHGFQPVDASQRVYRKLATGARHAT
jgi:chemotaxis protein methyltransferase CheR